MHCVKWYGVGRESKLGNYYASEAGDYCRRFVNDTPKCGREVLTDSYSVSTYPWLGMLYVTGG